MHLGDFFKNGDKVRKATLSIISPNARKAVEDEIVPMLEEQITNADMIAVMEEQALNLVTVAVTQKNESYTRLIRYKSIDQSDTQFFDDVKKSISEWANKMSSSLMSLDSEGEEEPPLPSLKDIANERSF
jgi:hypothetical protein